MVAASAAQPGAPRRSKQARWGLTATHAGPAASTSAAHCAATAAAARSAGDPSAGAASTASGHSRAGSGSSPSTTCDRRSATATTSRSPNEAVTAAVRRALPVYGLLQLRPGGEARDAGRGDVDRLAGARVLPLTGAPLGDVELAEAGERDLAATRQYVLDGSQHGFHGALSFLLAQAAARRDLVDELGLRHYALLRSSMGHSTLTAPTDTVRARWRRDLRSLRVFAVGRDGHGVDHAGRDVDERLRLGRGRVGHADVAGRVPELHVGLAGLPPPAQRGGRVAHRRRHRVDGPARLHRTPIRPAVTRRS